MQGGERFFVHAVFLFAKVIFLLYFCCLTFMIYVCFSIAGLAPLAKKSIIMVLAKWLAEVDVRAKSKNGAGLVKCNIEREYCSLF